MFKAQQSAFIVLLSLVSGYVYSASWQISKAGEQIVVASQKRETTPSLFFAQTIVDAPVSAMLNLLNDTQRAPQWISNVISVNLLKEKSENEHQVRTLLNAHWPLKNRELLTHSRFYPDQRNCTLFIDIEAKPTLLPANSEFVRIQRMQASWSLYPLQSGQTLIRYEGWEDANTLLPDFVTDSAASSALYETFQKLRTIITEPQYQTPIEPLRGCIPSNYHPAPPVWPIIDERMR